MHRIDRYIVTILILLPLSFCGYERASYFIQRENLGPDTARTIAQGLLSHACSKQCSKRGINIDSFHGPREGQVNRATDSKKFEFTWDTTEGSEIQIVIWDTGFYIESEYWWTKP